MGILRRVTRLRKFCLELLCPPMSLVSQDYCMGFDKIIDQFLINSLFCCTECFMFPEVVDLDQVNHKICYDQIKLSEKYFVVQPQFWHLKS